MKTFKLFFILFLIPLFTSCSAILQKEKNTSNNFSESNSSMVVTENPLSTDIANNILISGGNAFDAAIAASFALSVIRPHSTGIGGGGFFLLKKATHSKPLFLDARERAPALIKKNTLDEVSIKDKNIKGALIGTPGMVLGLEEVYKKYGSGKLSWQELIEPSIKLANNGFKIYPHLKEAIKFAEKRASFKLPQELINNNKFINKELGSTLEKISLGGASAFYEGAIAESIVRTSKIHGGLISLQDLRDYKILYRDPFKINFNGNEIYTASLPSSAGVVIGQILKLREQNLKLDTKNEAKLIDFLSKSMNLAFKDRALKLGDPAFQNINQKKLISKEYIKKLSRSLNSKSKNKKDLSPEPFPTSTTHLSIIDKEGNIVSSTQSINLYFGSGLISKGTGIFLNNTLDDFSRSKLEANAFGLVGKSANYPKGNKTHLSSMAPTIVITKGKPKLVLGSPGGPRIISAVAQTIINSLEHKQNLISAVSAPRIHRQWKPDVLYLEKEKFSKISIIDLKKLGHEIKESNYSIGNISAIEILSNGEIIGVADPRRKGKAAGL